MRDQHGAHLEAREERQGVCQHLHAAQRREGSSQLDEHYHQAGRNSILQNTALQVYFAANDQATARHVSEKLGTRTIETRSTSRQTGFFADTWRPPSESTGMTGRAFMLPEEIQRLDQKKEILFVEGHRPVLGRKILYYADPAFQKRLCPPPAVPKLTVSPRPIPTFDLCPDQDDEADGEVRHSASAGSSKGKNQKPKAAKAKRPAQDASNTKDVLAAMIAQYVKPGSDSK